MAKEKKKEDEKKPVTDDYVFTDERTIEERVDEKMREEQKKHLEQDDIHILDVAKNPPEPGYMRSVLKKAEMTTKNEKDEPVKTTVVAMPIEKKTGGEPIVLPDDISIFVNKEGELIQVFDPIFDIDLKQMADGQISDCASTIFPMLLDEAVGLAVDEKKARTTEKRKEEFKWWWVILLILIIIPILLITLTVLPGLFGGG